MHNHTEIFPNDRQAERAAQWCLRSGYPPRLRGRVVRVRAPRVVVEDAIHVALNGGEMPRPAALIN